MNKKYSYSYVAPTVEERRELEGIKNEYLDVTFKNDKLALIRKLDRKVKQLPIIIGLCLGIIGCLIFGAGLTFFLEWNTVSGAYIIGSILGLVGIILMSVAYPINKKLKNALKNKYGATILSLTNELLENLNQTN